MGALSTFTIRHLVTRLRRTRTKLRLVARSRAGCALSGKPPVVPTTRSFRLTTATWVGQRGSYEGIGGGTSPRAWAAAPRRSPVLWERRA